MVRPVRRIVAGTNFAGKATVLSDGPSPDVILDPARPGFASTRLWVTDSSPARVKGISDTLSGPHLLEPPRGGTQCRYEEYPPEESFLRRVGRRDVEAYYQRMGSPAALAAGPGAPHPYMQRLSSLDLTYVLEGEIHLVLETQEVVLKQGDILIQRGTAHAFSNRSSHPAILIHSQHHGVRSSKGPARPLADQGVRSEFADGRRNLRRVLTGHDANGRSCVIYDGPVPNVFPRKSGSWFYEVCTVDDMPADLAINDDGGRAGRPVAHSPPTSGANWRISYSPPDPSAAKSLAGQEKAHAAAAMDTGGGTQRSESGTHKGLHRTPSVDYAVCLEGERILILEDGLEVPMGKGDAVIQLGNWHSWGHRERIPTLMSYVMIGGEFG